MDQLECRTYSVGCLECRRQRLETDLRRVMAELDARSKRRDCPRKSPSDGSSTASGRTDDPGRKTTIPRVHLPWRCGGRNSTSPRRGRGGERSVGMCSVQVGSRTPTVSRGCSVIFNTEQKKFKKPSIHRCPAKSRTIIDYILHKAKTQTLQDPTVKHCPKPAINEMTNNDSQKTVNVRREKICGSIITLEPDYRNQDPSTVNTSKKEVKINGNQNATDCCIKRCRYHNKFNSNNRTRNNIKTKKYDKMIEHEANKTIVSKATSITNSLEIIANVTSEQCPKFKKPLLNKVLDKDAVDGISNIDINKNKLHLLSLINKNKRIPAILRRRNRRGFYRRYYVLDQNNFGSSQKNRFQVHRSKYVANKYRQRFFNACRQSKCLQSIHRSEGPVQFVTLTNEIKSKLIPRKSMNVYTGRGHDNVSAKGSTLYSNNSNIDVKSVSTSLIQDYLYKTINKHINDKKMQEKTKKYYQKYVKNSKYPKDVIKQRKFNRTENLTFNDLSNKSKSIYDKELKNIDTNEKFLLDHMLKSQKGGVQDYNRNDVYKVVSKMGQISKKSNTFLRIKSSIAKELKIAESVEEKSSDHDYNSDRVISRSKNVTSKFQYENCDITKYQSIIIENVLRILKDGIKEKKLCFWHKQFITSAVMIIIKTIVSMKSEELVGINLDKPTTNLDVKYKRNGNKLPKRIKNKVPGDHTYALTADECGNKSLQQNQNENKEIDVLFSSAKVFRRNKKERNDDTSSVKQENSSFISLTPKNAPRFRTLDKKRSSSLTCHAESGEIWAMPKMLEKKRKVLETTKKYPNNTSNRLDNSTDVNVVGFNHSSINNTHEKKTGTKKKTLRKSQHDLDKAVLDCDKNISFEKKSTKSQLINIVESCDECVMASTENRGNAIDLTSESDDKLTSSLYNCDGCGSVEIIEKLIMNIAKEIKGKYSRNSNNLKGNNLKHISLNNHSSVILRATCNERIQTHGLNLSDDGGLLYLDCADVHDVPACGNKSLITINCSFIRKKIRESLGLSTSEKPCTCSERAKCTTKETGRSETNNSKRSRHHRKKKINAISSSDENEVKIKNREKPEKYKVDTRVDTKHTERIKQEQMPDDTNLKERRKENIYERSDKDVTGNDCKRTHISDSEKRMKHKSKRNISYGDYNEDDNSDSEEIKKHKSRRAKKNNSMEQEFIFNDGCGGKDCSKENCKQKHPKTRMSVRQKYSGDDEPNKKTNLGSDTKQNSRTSKESDEGYKKNVRLLELPSVEISENSSNSSNNVQNTNIKNKRKYESIASTDQKQLTKKGGKISSSKHKEKSNNMLATCAKYDCPGNTTDQSANSAVGKKSSRWKSGTSSFTDDKKVKKDKSEFERKSSRERSKISYESSSLVDCAERKHLLKGQNKKNAGRSRNTIGRAENNIKGDNKGTDEKIDDCAGNKIKSDVSSKKQPKTKFKHDSKNQSKPLGIWNGAGNDFKSSQRKVISDESFRLDCSGNKVKNSKVKKINDTLIELDCSGNKIKMSRPKNISHKSSNDYLSGHTVKSSMTKEPSKESLDNDYSDNKSKPLQKSEIFEFDCSGNKVKHLKNKKLSDKYDSSKIKVKKSKVKKITDSLTELDCSGNKVKMSRPKNISHKSSNDYLSGHTGKSSMSKEPSNEYLDNDYSVNKSKPLQKNEFFGLDCSGNKVKTSKSRKLSNKYDCSKNKVKEKETLAESFGIDYRDKRVKGSKDKKTFDVSFGYDCAGNKVNISKIKNHSEDSLDPNPKNKVKRSKGEKTLKKSFGLDCSGNKVKTSKGKNPSNDSLTRDESFGVDYFGNKVRMSKNEDPLEYSPSQKYPRNKDNNSKNNDSPDKSFSVDCSGNKVKSPKVRDMSNESYGLDCSGNTVRIFREKIHSKNHTKQKVGPGDRIEYSDMRYCFDDCAGCKIERHTKHRRHLIAKSRNENSRTKFTRPYTDDEIDEGD